MMSMLVNKGVLTSPLPAPAVNWVSVVNLISPYYFLLFCCLTELRILQPVPDPNMIAFLQRPPGQSPVTPQTYNNPSIVRSLQQFPGEFSYTCSQRASRL